MTIFTFVLYTYICKEIEDLLLCMTADLAATLVNDILHLLAVVVVEIGILDLSSHSLEVESLLFCDYPLS